MTWHPITDHKPTSGKAHSPFILNVRCIIWFQHDMASNQSCQQTKIRWDAFSNPKEWLRLCLLLRRRGCRCQKKNKKQSKIIWNDQLMMIKMLISLNSFSAGCLHLDSNRRRSTWSLAPGAGNQQSRHWWKKNFQAFLQCQCFHQHLKHQWKKNFQEHRYIEFLHLQWLCVCLVPSRHLKPSQLQPQV